MAGTIGTIGTYSFHATKTITTGEGGMVVTANPDLDEKMRLYRSHGMLREKRYYWHEVPGHNFRLTNMQAAMGCAQLENFEKITAARRKIPHLLRKAIPRGGRRGQPQHFPNGVSPVLWAMALKLSPDASPQGRATTFWPRCRLAGRGMPPGFYAASQQPIYHAENLPVSEELADQVLSVLRSPALKIHRSYSSAEHSSSCGDEAWRSFDPIF